MAHPPFTVCGVGLKAAVFVERLLDEGFRPTRLFSYNQPNDRAKSFHHLKSFAERLAIPFTESRSPELSASELTFLVGWQYLIRETTPATVVFHDSLLPRYRGFAPTATALINGDRTIGITALRPVSDVDAGPIFGQRSIEITYPITIRTAIELQATLMADVAIDLLTAWKTRPGFLETYNQDEGAATYSLWRDELDYSIDWSKTASQISRFVDALSWPFGGAQCFVNGSPAVVESVTEVADLTFECRNAGKVWRLDQGRPIVVCGVGLLRLDHVLDLHHKPVSFSKVRVRVDR